MSIHSYGKIYALGHRQLGELFADEVLVEEKVDGSQISFGRDAQGELKIRSKGQQISLDVPDKMFSKGVTYIKTIVDKLVPGWTYRGEYLNSPSHNVLAYDRIPKNHIIIFDIDSGTETYMGPDEKKKEASMLDLETVPAMFLGKITTSEEIKHLLENVSVLGGQKVEGLVVKNYSKKGIDGHTLMGKYVSELFKEVNNNKMPKLTIKSDIVDTLIHTYATEARWHKGLQHLREDGKIEDSPRDIGLLIKEVPEDILDECKDEIVEALFQFAWPQIRKGIIAGIPQWYKEQLLKLQFKEKEND